VSHRVGEHGSASVLVVAMVAVLLVVGAALGVVAAMVRAHRIAQSGADLAALAGAHSLALGHDGCLDAGRVAVANDVRLTGCRVEGRTLVVRVLAAGPHWLGQAGDLSAVARAGPA
jgi:secretion/DNA translocation related TadE-like protein